MILILVMETVEVVAAAAAAADDKNTGNSQMIRPAQGGSVTQT